MRILPCTIVRPFEDVWFCKTRGICTMRKFYVQDQVFQEWHEVNQVFETWDEACVYANELARKCWQ